MAQTKKAPVKRTTAKSSAKSTASKKKPKQAEPIRREVWGAVCIALTFLVTLACFKVDAVIIKAISDAGRGLFGPGMFFLPLSLALAAVILIFHRNRPVTMCLWCAFLITPLAGALIHIFMAPTGVSWGKGLFEGLWLTGRHLKSGGAFSGFFAFALSYLISGVGAGAVFLAAFAFCCWGSMRRIAKRIAGKMKERPVYPEPEPEPEPVKQAKESVRAVKKPGKELKPISATPAEFIAQEQLGEDKPAQKRGKKYDVIISDEEPRKKPVREPEPVSESEPAVPAELPPLEKPDPAREREIQKEVSSQVALEIEQELSEHPEYKYPPIDLLSKPSAAVKGNESEVQMTASRLEEDFTNFNIAAKVRGYTRGPSVTRYDVELEKGTKLGSLTRLSDDIALTLGCASVRIAPIPGQISMVGIEVPNRTTSTVAVRSVIDSAAFKKSRSKVTFAVGEDISGNTIVGDIAKLPHLLIAGTTGSGKSVCMNTIITSLLYKASPEEVRLIMIDPKMVELGIYNGIPHLLIPVVTDPKKAAGALQWAVSEMMRRYSHFAQSGVRDIDSYNDTVSRFPERTKLPYVITVIDELSDLMMVAAKDVEESICRIAQMGRAAGIHLVIATQRPSADVITGLMKANIPSRIAFAVASAMESRIILDSQGAERLVGHGDMLFSPIGSGKPTRVQGCFITSDEVEAVAEYVKSSSDADYSEEILSQIEKNAEKGQKTPAPESFDDEDPLDELFSDAVEVVLETSQASASMLQRRLKLGYARAARIIDQMEQKGIVGPFEGSKARQILTTREKWIESGQASERFMALEAQTENSEENEKNC